MGLGTWDPRAGNADARGDEGTRWLERLDQAAAEGVNLIDTADVYQGGKAERLVGKWLRTVDRRTVVVATKVGGRTWDGSNGEGAGRKHLREACEASLRQLRTDYIDIYQLHSPDPGTPIDETVDALDTLVRSGKILYWGLSNWPPAAARRVAEYATGTGMTEPVSLQNALNLLTAAKLANYQDLRNMGLLAYSPLAQGLLADRQLDGRPTEGSRVAVDPALAQRLARRIGFLLRLRTIAHNHGLTVSQLALAWLLHQPAVSSVLIGVSTPQQLAENLAAADAVLSGDVLADIAWADSAPDHLAPTVRGG
jgi:aryl-alcohol dehydrogenase-like predicted oxidoreductase